MDQPIIANNRPSQVDLTEGKEYYFCTCGQSAKQPFCDGSHKGGNFRPLVFVAEHSGDAWLCNCKHSDEVPFCDGSHASFSDAQVGKTATDT